MITICENCLHQIEGHAVLCPQCGHPIPPIEMTFDLLARTLWLVQRDARLGLNRDTQTPIDQPD